jgi:hypothetical protein
MYKNHLFFVHNGETSESIEFADAGIAEIRGVFCTPLQRPIIRRDAATGDC